jgi:hypothetical protein
MGWRAVVIAHWRHGASTLVPTQPPCQSQKFPQALGATGLHAPCKNRPAWAEVDCGLLQLARAAHWLGSPIFVTLAACELVLGHSSIGVVAALGCGVGGRGSG